MDKLRNFKNRLSMSVDKLSPSRRSKSHQRKSMPLANAPFSEGDIPGSVRSSRASTRPTSAAAELTSGGSTMAEANSRPSSYCDPDTTTEEESGVDWLKPGNSLPEVSQEVEDDPTATVAATSVTLSVAENPLKRSTSSGEGGQSLMAEVMKEVEKITEITDDVKTKRLKTDSGVLDDEGVTVSDKTPLLEEASADTQQQHQQEADLKDNPQSSAKPLNVSDQELPSASAEVTVVHKHEGSTLAERKAVESTSTTLSTSSTCRAESLTSGYFSDSDVTLSDGRSESGYLKSSSQAVENTESINNKSVTVSTTSETKESNRNSLLVSTIPLSSKGKVEEEEEGKSAFTLTTSESVEKRKSLISNLFDDKPESKSVTLPSEQTPATASASTSVTSKKEEESLLASKELKTETTDQNQPILRSPPSQQETTTTKAETMSKRESIYSRIIKKKDSSSSKEPIYAKIKPKLSIETSFQPIDPITSKGSTAQPNSGIVKPEPMYTSVRPRDPMAPLVPTSPTSPTSPVSPTGSFCVADFGAPSYQPPPPPLKVEPIYTKVLPKDARSHTLPREPIYSKVRKETGTLPREPLNKAKTKEPIYAKPLPLTPREEALQRRESFLSQSSTSPDYYGKVTVRATEIQEVPPSRPAVITINNPGYAAPTTGSVPSPTSPSSSTTAVASPSQPVMPSSPLSSPSSPLLPSSTTSGSSLTCPTAALPTSTSTPAADDRMVSSPSPEKAKTSLNTTCPPASLTSLESSEPRHLLASDSSLLESSDTESTGRAKLSRLVEELAQELEEVSRRIGSDGPSNVDSKKEVLAKLLSTYDVPKNLRRVEEADEAAVREAEQALVPTSVSMDELRYVDDNEDNAHTVYADVPDYSQDEFMIALDDETNPKYASLTRALRRKKHTSESPGKVSKRTVSVYANAINVVSALKVLLNSKSAHAATVLNKMGSLARPYAHRVQGTISDTTWIQRVIYHKSGHNGFDELRRYIKSGGEFCKELATIMHERAELEATYAKSLQKLSGKLVKASKESMGTVNHSWQMVASQMEQEGDVHKSRSSSITDDVVRPLRQLIETQHKIRKGVESMVDKTTKNLHDWRAAETKAKKSCYANCRENEKIQDVMIEARLGRGKTLSDKETLKMEKQRRKAEEAVQKSDLDYYTCCVRTERARLEWESAVYKGSNCFQTLEEERLQALKDLVMKYHKNTKESAPKMVAIADHLDNPVEGCDVEKDIQTVISAKGTGENIPEQMLPDFYAEDMNNIMNRERRREALEKFVHMLRTDLERERRGKQGVENLAKALQETPTFGGEDSQQDVNDKLQHMKAMLAYLEAARYKVQCSLDELNNRPKMTHPLAKHIEVHRDKQGLAFSILKVPPWVRGNSVDVSPASDSPTGSPNWNDRGTADGTSVQPDSDFDDKSNTLEKNKSNLKMPTIKESSPHPLAEANFSPVKSLDGNEDSDKTLTTPKATASTTEQPIKPPRVFMSAPRYPSLMVVTDEFSSQGSDREYQTAVTGEDNLDSGHKEGTYYARPLASVPSGGRCKALYDYEANMYDELTIRTGDIINLHEKQTDGWWVGELDGVIGIFPATYVEEID